MYLEINNKTNYASTNENYKRNILPLVDYIFNPNKIVFGYFLSSPENYKHKRYQILDPTIENINRISIDENIDKFGVFEEILKTHIISQDYSVLILTGASGSGKTSIINHVKSKIDDCKDSESCIRYSICQRKKKEFLYFDFLTDDADSISSFDFKLNGFLCISVELCFSDEDVITNFLNECRNTKDSILINLKYIISPINYNSSIEEIIKKIKDKNLSIADENDILKAMLKYIREQYPEQHKGCFTIIFDNIDKMPDEHQTEVIKKIVSLHNSVKCKIVITSRLTSFYKLNDNFSNVYSVIENAGPTPSDIIFNRIKYYIDNRNILSNITEIRNSIIQAGEQNSEFINCFDNILIELLKYLSPDDNQSGTQNEESKKIDYNKYMIQKTLSSFSGLSVRRGIEISKRFVTPMTFNYYDTPTSNQLTASLSFRCSRGIKFNDKFITNIYGKYNDNRRNSWILYRLLNILYVCQSNKIDITVYQLFDTINLFDIVTEDDFIYSINILVDSNKRLAYISGYSHIISIDKNSQKNSQKIHITNCGRDYFLFLATDLNYIQNSFAALDWKTISHYVNESDLTYLINNIHINQIHKNEADLLIEDIFKHIKQTYIQQNKTRVFNMSNILERMEFIRIGLETLLFHDIFESFSFNENKTKKNKIQEIVTIIQFSDEINSFPTLRLTLSSAESFLKIIRSYYRNNHNLPIETFELVRWRDFIKKADLWNKILFKVNILHSSKLIDDYDEFINQIIVKTN